MKNCSKIMRASLILGFFASASLADISKNDGTVSDYAVELQADLFSFDDQGILIDGPRRSPSDPIDHSSLLNEVYMRFGFEASLFECDEYFDACPRSARRYKEKTISVMPVHVKPSLNSVAVSDRDMENISAAMINSVNAIGITTKPASDIDHADLIFMIGSTTNMRPIFINLSDEIGLKEIKRWKNETGGRSILSILGVTKNDPPFCYVSEKAWKSAGKITIYVNINGIEDCLEKALLAAIGLKSTALDIPSITDRYRKDKKYKTATFADILYARLLYHQDFPVDGSLEDVRAFWEKHAARIWQELVTEGVHK